MHCRSTRATSTNSNVILYRRHSLQVHNSFLSKHKISLWYICISGMQCVLFRLRWTLTYVSLIKTVQYNTRVFPIWGAYCVADAETLQSFVKLEHQWNPANKRYYKTCLPIFLFVLRRIMFLEAIIRCWWCLGFKCKHEYKFNPVKANLANSFWAEGAFYF